MAVEEDIIRHCACEHMHSDVIASLVWQTGYTSEHEQVMDVVNALAKHGDILALGIVDRDMHPVGIVTRKALFDAVGRPFGKDVLAHKQIGTMAERTPIFPKSKNLFTITESLTQELSSRTRTSFFSLMNNDGTFAGIVSSRDMHIYLSEITTKDIRLAQMIQSGIVADEKIFTSDHLRIFGASTMAKGVGGDFYFARRIHNGSWVVCIGDVSGKGVAASLVTAVFAGMWSTFDFSAGIEAFIAQTNNFFVETFFGEKFVTGIIAEISEDRDTIRLCDMGHSLLYLFTRERVERIATSGDNIPLGIRSMQAPAVDTLVLPPDATLVMVTDGALEQDNQTDEEFGETRLLVNLRPYLPGDMPKAARALYAAVQKFRGEYSQSDDITLCMVERC